jgi:hypothetical protein
MQHEEVFCMNCVSFATIITELARDQIVEAHLREAALEHPQYCAVCANRFANEMALTAGLRAFAAETAAIRPSNKIETVLLDAFRSQIVVIGESSTKEVLSIVKPTVAWSKFAMAAAAIILIALTSITVIAIRAQRNHAARSNDIAKAGTPKPEVSNSTSTNNSGSQSGSVKDDNQNNILVSSDHKIKTVQHRIKNGRNREVALVNNPDPTAGFISLTQAADFMPLESGQIVKVEMPRAALLAIGLPVNAQRAGESIKAELLVGQDGIARAIRFLQ